MLCSKDFYEGQPRRRLLVKFIFSLPIFPQETFLRLGMSTQFIYSIVRYWCTVPVLCRKDKFFSNQNNFMFCTDYLNYIRYTTYLHKHPSQSTTRNRKIAFVGVKASFMPFRIPFVLICDHRA